MSAGRDSGRADTRAPVPPAGWQQVLRAAGYRMTPQRQLVLGAITELGHATPEEILAAVRQQAAGVNLSTVYRTLDLLEELGLVSHAHLRHGAPTYHPGSLPAHAHLVCTGCGDIQETSPGELTPLIDSLRTERGFVVDVRHLTVHGRCARCTS